MSIISLLDETEQVRIETVAARTMTKGAFSACRLSRRATPKHFPTQLVSGLTRRCFAVWVKAHPKRVRVITMVSLIHVIAGCVFLMWGLAAMITIYECVMEFRLTWSLHSQLLHRM